MKTSSRFILAAMLLITAVPLFGKSARSSEWHPTLKPINAEMPSYPIRALHEGVTNGTVELTFEVQIDGTIGDRLITAYTHPELARVTDEAVARWRFEPSEAVHVVDLKLQFETRGVIAIVKQPGAETGRPVFVFRPCPPSQLDQLPRVVSQVQPAYSDQMEAAGTVGEVTVQYFIDEQGRVRLPYTAETAHPLLAALAVQAVKQWQFEPPTCNGRPALVRAAQSFRFGETAATSRVGSSGTS